MRELTGDYITEFNQLGDAMSLVSPEPQAIESWTQLSLDQNLGVIASRHAAETARKEVSANLPGTYLLLIWLQQKHMTLLAVVLALQNYMPHPLDLN